jgi:hypothetical protein
MDAMSSSNRHGPPLTEDIMPSVYVLKLGPLTFTLSLSRWGADSIGRPRPALLTRREPVGAEELLAVYESLRDTDSATDAELAHATGLSVEQCRLATAYLCQSGRAMVDPRGSGEGGRVESGADLGPAAVSARRIVETGNVRLTACRPTADGWKLSGSARGKDGQRRRPLLHIDRAGRIIEASCTCPQSQHSHPAQGLCEHMLALRLAHLQRATSN